MIDTDEYEEMTWQEHMDLYEDGYCSKCDETWNIDAHACHCPTCGAKMIARGEEE